MSFQNVFACLVHDQEDCVLDLVKNLSFLDPTSKIILYNGGKDPYFLKKFPVEKYRVLIHPCPQPLDWGWLHDFAVDVMEYALCEFHFDTLTIVDSDQLLIGKGYSDYLQAFLQDKEKVGMLGKSAERQGRNTRNQPVKTAFREQRLWQPFLSKLANGRNAFPHWTFWPSTVFTQAASRELVPLFRENEELQSIMDQCRVQATEEVVLPTLVKALGFDILQNPCSYEYVQWRKSYTSKDLEKALTEHPCFWMHPVPRQKDHLTRVAIADYFKDYEISGMTGR